MNCPTCPRPGRPCWGELIRRICNEPAYLKRLLIEDPPRMSDPPPAPGPGQRCTSCINLLGICLGLTNRNVCAQARLGIDITLTPPSILRSAAKPEEEPKPVPLDAARAVLRCPHKGPPACSCNSYATCSLGKGRAGQVSYAECVACVSQGTENTEHSHREAG